MTGQRQPDHPNRLVDYVRKVLAQARPPLPQDRRRPVPDTSGYGPDREADDQGAQDPPQPGQARDAAAAQAAREIVAEAELRQVGVRYAGRTVAASWYREAVAEGFPWKVAHEAALFVLDVADGLAPSRSRGRTG